MPTTADNPPVSADSPTLGEFIRLHREMSELPMRQLAAMVGISGPYLSQIERNLRAPSDRVLYALAEQLQISADTLMAQSRGVPADGLPETIAAIRRDKGLSPAQRKALEEMYETFLAVTVEKRRSSGRSQTIAEETGRSSL